MPKALKSAVRIVPYTSKHSPRSWCPSVVRVPLTGLEPPAEVARIAHDQSAADSRESATAPRRAPYRSEGFKSEQGIECADHDRRGGRDEHYRARVVDNSSLEASLSTSRRILTNPRLGRGEVLVISALFLGFAFLFYGWFAFHGGFVADDWLNAAKYYYPPGGHGFWAAVDNYQTPSRPVAAFYVSLTYAILGDNFHLHLVVSVVLAGALSGSFYGFLRVLGLSRLVAFAAALLLLVFPSSDSTRFWATGSQIDLFMAMYLLGTTISIVGRRRFGPGLSLRSVTTHVLGSAIVVAAVAGYEIVAPAVLLSFVLYRWAGGRGGVVWRWLMQALPTALILIFLTRKFSGGPDPISQWPSDLRTVANGAVSIFGYTVDPVLSEPRWVMLSALIALGAVLAIAWRLAPASAARDATVRWLPRILLAIVGVAVGYVMLVPGAVRYPLVAPGVQNRSNCLAALGLCALVVFEAIAIASLVAWILPFASDRIRGRLRFALTFVMLVVIFSMWSIRINQDRKSWQIAALGQAELISATKQLVPHPAADDTLFTAGYPGYSAPSIPIFGGGGNNDEVSAFEVLYHEPTLRAFPILDGAPLACERKYLWTPDAGNSPTDYGKGLLLDLADHRLHRPENQAQCNTDLAKIPLAPINLTSTW